ncbi:MAG TPA: beta-propeller fold lactonase family protein [Desulfomonilaceae bacterium]|nr:beta-propeller fold lactonase family protein [Desulfomonilaceae bacterium]
MNRIFRTAISTLGLLLTLWIAALLAACGGSGTPEPPSKTLSSIQVTPTSMSISVGSSLQFTATGSYSDGSTGDVSSAVTWSSSDTSEASINSAGKVIAVSIGRPKITATSGAVSGSTQLIIVSAEANNIPRFAFVANMVDGTLSAFTVNPGTGQLRHNGYQLVGSFPGAVVVEPRGKYVYAANSNSSSISAFSTDPSGHLSVLPGSPFTDDSNPLALVVDPTGSFLYSANSGSSTVVAYSISASTGALTPIPGSPITVGAGPSALALDPLGKFLFVANQAANSISAFAIAGDTGALTPVSGSPFIGGTGPSAVAVDPTGQFLLAANSGSADVSVFSVNPSTGILTAVAGSPFATGGGKEISGITVSPDGKTVYVSNFGSSNISVLALGNTGTLKSVAGSPFAVDADPRALQIDPSGHFAYVPILTACEIEVFSIAADGSLSVANRIRARQQAAAIAFSSGASAVMYTPKFLYATNLQSNNLSGFLVDDASGTLSPIPGAPFATGGGPFGVATDPRGTFIYVSNGVNSNTNQYEKSISGFVVNSDGSLTAIQGSPFPAGAGGAGLTVDPSGRFLYATNYNDFTLSAYSIDPDSGILTALPGSPYPTGREPVTVTVDPAGRFLYVGNQNNTCDSPPSPSCPISAFQINPVDGTLTSITGPTEGGIEPSGLAIDPTGQFLYLSNQSLAAVSQYSIDAIDGTLKFVGYSPMPVLGGYSVASVVDPSGKYVISDFGESLYSFAIDPASGALPTTPSNSVVTGAPALFYMGIDPSGHYVYIADQGASPTFQGKIWAFSFNAATGALTPVSSSPFAAGTAAISVTVTGEIH